MALVNRRVSARISGSLAGPVPSVQTCVDHTLAVDWKNIHSCHCHRRRATGTHLALLIKFLDRNHGFRSVHPLNRNVWYVVLSIGSIWSRSGPESTLQDIPYTHISTYLSTTYIHPSRKESYIKDYTYFVILHPAHFIASSLVYPRLLCGPSPFAGRPNSRAWWDMFRARRCDELSVL